MLYFVNWVLAIENKLRFISTDLFRNLESINIDVPMNCRQHWLVEAFRSVVRYTDKITAFELMAQDINHCT